MSDFVLQFDCRVAGIPCQIGVVNYERYAPMSVHKAHSDLEFYGYSEVDYVVLDRRGRPAPWLQRKVDDDSSIIEQINELMGDSCDY
jgi:hypothetical protein